MSRLGIPSSRQPNPLVERIEEIKAELRQRNPQVLAQNTYTHFTPSAEDSNRGVFSLHLWEKQVTLSFPDFEMRYQATATPLNPLEQGIVLYYYLIADGTPPSREWIAFTALPNGRFYTQAFQGYTGRELRETFGNDLDAFQRAAEVLGGQGVDFADRAFIFSALPLVSLLVAAWQGDEDFPPSYNILFDANSHHHLTTDACAIVGSQLTHRLLAAGGTIVGHG